MKRKWLSFSLFFCVFGSAFLFLFSPAYLFRDHDARFAAAVISLPLMLLCGVAVPCRVFCGRDWLRELGLTVPGKSDVLPVLSAIPLFFLFMLCSAIARMAGIPVAPQTLARYAESCSGGMFLLVLFCAGILAPLAEELAYRRVLFGVLRENFSCGEIPACFLTSLLFAVSHGVMWQSVQLFFFGLFLQWQQKKGSTTRSILIHSLLNFCSLSALCLIRAGLVPA